MTMEIFSSILEEQSFFKVYDVEDNKIVSSEVIGSNGTGHGALAGLLANHGIDVLICGGIGGGAQAALSEAGVELVAGASGDVDQAVESYLKGELESTGANCDHHHGEGHSCGDHGCGHHEEDNACGDSCGSGCGGGCGSHPVIEGRNVGKTCRAHYVGTFNDGTQFDSSYDRGEPLQFVCGVGQMIRGFDAAVGGYGSRRDCQRAYHAGGCLRPSRPQCYSDFLRLSSFRGLRIWKWGQKVYLANQYGQPFQVKVTAKDEKTITLDANDEMAGKELNFKIELVEVK